MPSHKRKTQQEAPTDSAGSRHVRRRTSPAPSTTPVPCASELTEQATQEQTGRMSDVESAAEDSDGSDDPSDSDSEGSDEATVRPATELATKPVTDPAGEERSEEVEPASEGSSEAKKEASEEAGDGEDEGSRDAAPAGGEASDWDLFGEDDYDHPEMRFAHDLDGQQDIEDAGNDEEDDDANRFDEAQYEEPQGNYALRLYEDDADNAREASDGDAHTAIFSTDEPLGRNRNGTKIQATNQYTRSVAVNKILEYTGGAPDEALEKQYHPHAHLPLWGVTFLVKMSKILAYASTSQLNAWIKTRVDWRKSQFPGQEAPKQEVIARKADLDAFLDAHKPPPSEHDSDSD